MFDLDDEDDDLELDPDETPEPPPTPAPAALPPLAAQVMASSTVSPALKDAMAKRYSLADYSPEKRQALVDSNNSYDTTGAISGALAALSAGLRGGDSVGAANQMLNQRRQMKQQAVEDFDKSRSIVEDSEQRDPDSDASKRFRSTLQANFPQIVKQYGDQFGKLTASDQKTVFQVAETKARLDEAAARRESVAATKDLANQTRADAQKDKKDKKSQDDYDKYVSGIERQAQTLRGDDAAKLSSAKLSAIASGRALLKQYEGREDEMTPDQLALLAADRVKAVTGGVPTNEEIKHMMPSNLGTAGAGIKSYFTGSPAAANSGGWVKEAAKDFDLQEKSARDILKNRQAQVTSNPRLRPEDQARISKMAVPPEFDASQPASFPMQVRKDGKMATVKSQSELDEAKSEGWQ